MIMTTLNEKKFLGDISCMLQCLEVLEQKTETIITFFSFLQHQSNPVMVDVHSLLHCEQEALIANSAEF